MTFYLLFVFFMALCLWMLNRVPFSKKSGLPTITLSIFFVIKVIAGVLLGLISLKYYPDNDYWNLNIEGAKEFIHLKKDPWDFFTDIFHSHYQNKYGHFLDAAGSYWNDLRYNILIKIVAICNLISGGNYYINTLIFDFVGFWGLIALFRVFNHLFPGKKNIIALGCFLLPSTLYFCSGLQKDLVVMTSLCFLCYGLYFNSIRGNRIKNILLIIGSFITILLMRNFLAIAILPPFLAYVISLRTKKSAIYIFSGIYFAALIFILITEIAYPKFNPLIYIVNRQTAFLALPKAGSQIAINILEPNLISFIKNLPQALNHVFLRPYLWENKNLFSLLLSFENVIYFICLPILFFKALQLNLFKNPFILFLISFSIGFFLIIGYTVPNFSSIIRYKSLFLPFIITPFLATFSFKNRGL